MGREDPQFNLRLPADLKDKLKQRAKLNGRSLNSEITMIIEDAISQPSKIHGYRDDAERLAHEHAERFKKVVVETLAALYRKDD
ncbi:Arc family DNA-binding protein [Serratia ureilytica]|uniref:Arc family DNA-binding protein n=1 Tax=Serratia ureilytica TaxID=300181 RepID=UPI001F4CCB9B|nr:Arc family DNA-binding protein [Serratia ureilytica]UNE41943.1 Arc family DNA-binding protein [Serratia ureilytica]